MPVSSSPNNTCPTSDGTISNAKPVAASATAAKMSTFFMASLIPKLPTQLSPPEIPECG